jgi:hypothetical protein
VEDLFAVAKAAKLYKRQIAAMQKRHCIAGYRFVFGILGLMALVAQYTHNAQNIPNYQPWNFFSFFTVESNIFAVLVLLIAGFGSLYNKRHDTFAFLRGATTTYIVITGIIYSLLLAGTDVDTAVPWVNVVLHYILPVVVLADWIIDPPHKRIFFKRALLWLMFPITYVAYSLVRGYFVQWYPYPFLDPREQGYGAVLATSIAIGLAASVIAWTIAWVTRFGTAKAATK